LYYKGSQGSSIGQILQSSIKPNKRKTDYDEKKQALTITIPRVENEQEK